MAHEPNLPTGLTYLDFLTESKSEARSSYLHETTANAAHREQLSAIGTMLSALYQASTCHRKCHGGPHILEALIGRGHNLGSAALSLINDAHYDESLSLVRSIGEIANLVWLSILDPSMPKRWINATKKQRIREFGPGAVRAAIEKSGAIRSYLDSSWYSSLCEGYTHVTPSTKPNAHNAGEIGVVGGQFQRQGLETSMYHLFQALISLASATCVYFKFDDVMKHLNDHASALAEVGS